MLAPPTWLEGRPRSARSGERKAPCTKSEEAEPYLRTAYDIRVSGPNATELLMSRIALDLAACLMQLDRHAEADQLLTQLQLDFPELANGPENYSQRFRNVERELAERTARPREASAPGAGD